MPKVIGHYDSLVWQDNWTDGGKRHYTQRPFYGHRIVGLVSCKKDFEQILVDQIGGLMWINVKERLTPDRFPVHAIQPDRQDKRDA